MCWTPLMSTQKDETAVLCWFEKANLFEAWISGSKAFETDSTRLQAFLISFSSPCIFLDCIDDDLVWCDGFFAYSDCEDESQRDMINEYALQKGPHRASCATPARTGAGQVESCLRTVVWWVQVHDSLDLAIIMNWTDRGCSFWDLPDVWGWSIFSRRQSACSSCLQGRYTTALGATSPGACVQQLNISAAHAFRNTSSPGVTRTLKTSGLASNSTWETKVLLKNSPRKAAKFI